MEVERGDGNESTSTERVDVLSEADRYPKRMGMIKNEVDHVVKLRNDRVYILRLIPCSALDCGGLQRSITVLTVQSLITCPQPCFLPLLALLPFLAVLLMARNGRRSGRNSHIGVAVKAISRAIGS